MTKSVSEGGHLPAWRLWLFASPNFPLSALIIAVAIYLPQYFAKNLGLGLAAVGAAFAFIRLIDIPVDPLLGVAMDRTTSPWGRYRPWMLLGAPLLMLAVHMLFSAPYGVSASYVIVWLLVMYLGSSMITLSQSAWGASMATSYDERGRVFGAIGAAGVAGMTLLLALPLLASALMPRAINAKVPQMGLLIVVTTLLSALAATGMTPERVTPHKPGQGVTLHDYIALLLNPNMVRVSAATFLFTLGTSWEGGLYLFYYTDVRHLSAADASLMLLAALAAGLAGAPAISWLGAKTSKHGALITIAVAYGGALMTLWLIPLNAPAWVLYFPYVTSGFLFAGFLVLINAMTADISDEARLNQGKERSALVYALLTLAPKISSALAIWMTFTLLAQFGYRPAAGQANSAAAISALNITYVVGPNVCVILGALCFIRYPLNRRRASEIRALLDARDAAETSSQRNADVPDAHLA